MINGDSFFDVNLRNLERFKNSNTIGKIALTNNKNYKLNNKINNIKIKKNSFLLKFLMSSKFNKLLIKGIK